MKYLFRLDDASHTMDLEKWQCVIGILLKYNVKPLIGVIPDNQDIEQEFNKPLESFWELVKSWDEKGIPIAMHGLTHVYHYIDIHESLNKINPFSEFVGLSLDAQKTIIGASWEIFLKNNITPKFFFAPGHTYDSNTLKALKEKTSIRVISDTLALKPYILDDFIYIPQQLGRPLKLTIPSSYITICLHPNTMSFESINLLESFLLKNRSNLLGYDKLDLDKISTKLSIRDKCFKFCVNFMKAVRYRNADFLK